MSQKPTLDPGLTEEMSELYDHLMSVADKGRVTLKMQIAQKKIEQLATVGDDTEVYELLDILEFVVSNLPIVKDLKASELTWYKKAASILDIAYTQLDGIRSSHQYLLYPFDEHAQLRELRSKFDRLSAYLCYRFSSKFTNDVRTRPWTIWTIADRSRNQDRVSSVVVASKLFQHIATQVS